MGTLIVNLLRWICSWIDRLVILVMNLIYKLLMNISSLNIVSIDVIKKFSTRIGLVLGIFMLFNIAVTLLNYIASPDKFSDKAKGGAKIITNVIISLALLATYNSIFDIGYRIQDKVLEKQIIPQLIFGTSPQQETEQIEISYYIYSQMISINPKVDTNGVCNNIYFNGINDECDGFLRDKLPLSYYNFYRAVNDKDASNFLVTDSINERDNGEYIFDYMFIFSTIVGVIVLLILINFCLDIAKRSVKLYFYQIIAPIPIVANMVPGKGEETFKKWYKSCLSTYLDLFIRLIALFFAVFLIVTTYDALGNILSEHKFLGLFIILGTLMFAHELPQILQDLTGIKLDGKFTINPLKKIQQAPLAAGVLGYAGGLAGGAIANVWGTAVNNKNIRKQLAADGYTEDMHMYKSAFKEAGGRTLFGNKGGFVGSAFAGAHSAGFRSLWIGAHGGGNKAIGQIMSEGISGASMARNQRTAGYNLSTKLVDRATDIAQIKNDYGTTDLLKGKVKELQRQLANEQRNENMFTDLLRTRMDEMENRKNGTMEGMMSFFDNEAELKADGSFDHYKVKEYVDYINSIGKEEWIKAGMGDDAAWNSLNATEKATNVAGLAAMGKVLDEQEFETINNVYNRRNAADEKTKQLNKQIKSTEENMAKKSGQK